MQIKVSGRMYETPTLEAASRLYLTLWASACARGRIIRGAVIFKDGAPAYRVSQNGKIWSHELWTPDQAPVFDPYLTV